MQDIGVLLLLSTTTGTHTAVTRHRDTSVKVSSQMFIYTNIDTAIEGRLLLTLVVRSGTIKFVHFKRKDKTLSV